MEENRQMEWEDYWSSKFNVKMRKETSRIDAQVLEQMKMVTAFETEPQKWLSAIEQSYFCYAKSILTRLNDTEVRNYLDLSDEQGINVLQRAILAQDFEYVKYFLSIGALPFAKSLDGKTAFHYTAQVGNVLIFKYLIKWTAETHSLKQICHLDSHEFNLLHLSARKGHLKLLGFLIAAAPDLIDSVSCENESTPLHLAAAGGYVECAQLLLEAGAQLDKYQKDGNTPLHISLLLPFNVTNMFRVMLPHVKSSTLNERTPAGVSVLHSAISFNYTDVVEEILQVEGVDSDYYTKDGSAPLHLACQSSNAQIMKALIRSGATLDPTDNQGQSPLLLCAASGFTPGLLVLLSHGADATHQDIVGFSALHFLSASSCSDTEAFKALIAAGAYVDARTQNFNTSLHLAAMNGNEIAVRFLIDNGANFDVTNHDQRTAFYLANRWKHKNIVEIIAQSQTKRSNKHAIHVTTTVTLKMIKKSRAIQARLDKDRRRFSILPPVDSQEEAEEAEEDTLDALASWERQKPIKICPEALATATPFLRLQKSRAISRFGPNRMKPLVLGDKMPNQTAGKEPKTRKLKPLQTGTPAAGPAMRIPWKVTQPIERNSLQREIRFCARI